MIQYLHFRILEFPLIFPEIAGFLWSEGIACESSISEESFESELAVVFSTVAGAAEKFWGKNPHEETVGSSHRSLGRGKS